MEGIDVARQQLRLSLRQTTNEEAAFPPSMVFLIWECAGRGLSYFKLARIDGRTRRSSPNSPKEKYFYLCFFNMKCHQINASPIIRTIRCFWSRRNLKPSKIMDTVSCVRIEQEINFNKHTTNPICFSILEPEIHLERFVFPW